MPQLLSTFREIQANYHGKMELVVVGDTQRPLIVNQQDVNWITADFATVGMKRNLACHHAQGEIILHLDDDDWYHPHWGIISVNHLLTSKAALTGLSTLHFIDRENKKAWRYGPNGHSNWVAGATMCYTRAAWEAVRFKEMQIGEDNQFCKDVAKLRKVIPHRNETKFVATVHSGNTSNRHTDTPPYKAISYAFVDAMMSAG